MLKMSPFNLQSSPSEVMDYFKKIIHQYGSVQSFCKLNHLEPKFYHRMMRASSCMVTRASVDTLNESLKYYHPDVRLKEEVKELAKQTHDLIKSKYNSALQMCQSHDMMEDYQRIVGFCNGRRKKLPRELVLKIRKITSK